MLKVITLLLSCFLKLVVEANACDLILLSEESFKEVHKVEFFILILPFKIYF